MPFPHADLLRRLPKAELHCHLDGSVRPETLIELGREYGQPMPADDAEGLAEYMRVDDARQPRGLSRSLRHHAVGDADVGRPRAHRVRARDRCRRATAFGTSKCGMRRSSTFAADCRSDEAVEAPLRGLERAERDGGAMGRVIVCGLRNLTPDVSLELARLAVGYKHRGVVAFDLAGGELGNPASAHAAAFSFAREHDLPCTCHAGEGADAQSVREAVHVCGAHRIGHATRLIEDESLTEYVNDRRIALEICLTSNVQTRAVASYEQHPLRAYYDRGMNVVLNTDNRLMSGTTLTDEYVHAARTLGFSFDELAEVSLNGFRSAFLPWAERERLIARCTSRDRRVERGAPRDRGFRRRAGARRPPT